MDLGIAGNVVDVAGIAAASEALGVSPAFVLGPEDALAAGSPAVHLHHLPRWEVEVAVDRLKSARLGGLWTAQPHLRGVVAAIAERLGLPHMPCPAPLGGDRCIFTGAHVVSLQEIDDHPGPVMASITAPIWVRAACGDGDASCMRLEHAGDLSLASLKLRKRGVTGAVRLQPAIEGTIYRLPAFKTGRELVPVDIALEETTTSMFRVPLGFALPLPRRGGLAGQALEMARAVNRKLPSGWGYVEFEFVETETGLTLADLRCPASLDPLLCAVFQESLGIDLLAATLQCALGRPPQVSPRRELGAAATWLLTRSGTVTGFKGIEEARSMPGVETVAITAREGDALTHVVDIPSRERGGYILATGATMAVAKERLEAARTAVWINTTPVQL